MNSVLVTLSFLFFALPYKICKSTDPQIVKVPFVDENNPGTALFLTPLIESGKIDLARREAVVQHDEMGDVASYSGYLTVNKEYNSNLFFWFFPAAVTPSIVPVVLWLQGEPGLSSMFGLFVEHGPFSVTSEVPLSLKMRQYSWNLNHSVIYIDSPVGAGYSFTENEKGYARNFTQVARDLYTALVQFFLLFPELQNNDFFVTGQSYAGKYVAAVSHAIKENNIKAETKINLKGLAIGNGFCDPVNQLLYSDYLYQIGLIDLNGKAEFQKYEELIRDYIDNQKFVKAFEIYNKLFGIGIHDSPSLFKNLTDLDHHYNYIKVNVHDDGYQRFLFIFNVWIQRIDVARAMHVGSNPFNLYNTSVLEYQKEDVFESVVDLLTDLLKHYRVLIYNGQIDVVDAYPFAENYLQKMQWSGAEKFAKAPRKFWKALGEHEVTGYAKSVDNLTFVFIRNAGNLVSKDQPKWALELISRFTRNVKF